MTDLHDIGQLYSEKVFTNAVNSTAKKAFHGTVNAIDKQIPKGGYRNSKGRFRKEPLPVKIYNGIENALEKLFSLGGNIVGNATNVDISLYKAKIYYIILRQQPPVGVGFKRVLQQKIYDAKSVDDLDKLAVSYNAWTPWVSYKQYLQRHK